MRFCHLDDVLRLLILFTAGCTAASDASAITWSQAQRKTEADWFKSSEGQQVIENVLLLQLPCGGWDKNIERGMDMAEPLSNGQRRRLAQRTGPGTIDNDATYTQLRFLARAYSHTQQPRVGEAFLRGLDYLLEAQYGHGGWPMYYPLRGGYHDHIHFNDNGVSGVLQLMDDVARGDMPFGFVDSQRQERAREAFEKGIDCILKCQVVVDGQRTAWCAQHHEETLDPAPARAYEPVSLSGGESVGIVRCLMRVENPSPEVIEAIQSAADWFERVKIAGIRVEHVETPEGRDRVVKDDPEAPALWARFYEIGTNRPLFTGRDGIPRERFDQIERERRIGYAYYGNWPEKLLTTEYPAWAAKWGVAGD